MAAGDYPFVVLAMYTDGYAEKAERLRRSCDRLGLPHSLQRVTAIHDSISINGVPDLAFTKSNFVRGALDRLRKPLLYVDADCEFYSEPVRIAELLAGGIEFAIYNWAADRHTEAYVPAKIRMPSAQGTLSGPKRYFRFASKLDHYDPAQLLCSGAVQFYADTPAVRRLLEEWQDAIQRFPGSADDHCMDYTYNNRGPALAALRAAWLPKEYARYAWWPHVKPVINHPDFASVATHFKPIPETGGMKQFYPERAELLHVPPLFPPDCIIDTEQRRLLRVEGKRITLEQPIDQEFWT